ncbi:hypothetical protein TRVA0_020S02630 [Trichomonascus vanleenenianus]|uniref:transcription activator GCR1-like domain-containing protein n=1 Tax=Trichomonascus vanleenenianus TaxID=2268995 RepID=UPI003EC984B6
MSPRNHRIANTLSSRIDKNAQSATKKSIREQLERMLSSQISPNYSEEISAAELWGDNEDWLDDDDSLKSIEVQAIREALLTIRSLRQDAGITQDQRKLLHNQIEKDKKAFEGLQESGNLKNEMPYVYASFESLSKGVEALARGVAEIKMSHASILDRLNIVEPLAKRIESVEKTQNKIYSELKDLSKLVSNGRKSNTPESTPDPIPLIPPSDGLRLQEHIRSSLEALSASPEDDRAIIEMPVRSYDDDPPFIMDRSIQYVADAYKEWYEGINGQPSVVEFDAIYGKVWHKRSSGDNSWYYSRKKLVNEIDWAINQGLPHSDAIDAAQALVGTRSVYSLSSLQVAIRKAEKNGTHVLSEAVNKILYNQ